MDTSENQDDPATQELPDAWLCRTPLPPDPVPILRDWLDEAFAAGLQQNAHAVSLATIDPDGRPSARMVLCNHIDVERGAFVMYTNRESRKGRALKANPRAAIVFYWGPHQRSARVEGRVEFTPDAECDAYFATRPLDAQLGAWASAQSECIETREELVAKIEAQAERFGVRLGDASAEGIPRPPHWGGFTMVADAIELWVSRPARIHDRALWTRELDAAGEPGAESGWRVSRLQP
jgi:pyridoxamine 5'-phosphate oxidase